MRLSLKAKVLSLAVVPVLLFAVGGGWVGWAVFVNCL